MPDIRYIVLSDMHLGAENSILTNLRGNTPDTDTTKPGPALVELVKCIRELIASNTGTQKPTLVLNGDLIELALSTVNNALMAFERFVELLLPAGEEPIIADEILYLPGNHDHNLWERARGFYFMECMRNTKCGEVLGDEIFTTDMFKPIPLGAWALTTVLHRYQHLEHMHASMNYPARAILSEDKQRCVIFCHGHYVESMYSLMTSVRSRIFPDRKEPAFLDDLEKENYAWIDFFWSTLGRSGSVGQDINLIYDKLQDKVQVDKMIDNIANSFSSKHKNVVTRWVENKVMEEILQLTLGRLAASERNEPDVVLTPDATAGLKTMMEVYMANEIADELGGIIPPYCTFIFGHTHKPFATATNYKGYKQPVEIYNSGGWVVDTQHQQPLHGGSVILVDDQLQTVALQFYREGKAEVTVERAAAGDPDNDAFFEKMSSIVKPGEAPWATFSEIAADQVALRYSNLEIMIGEPD